MYRIMFILCQTLINTNPKVIEKREKVLEVKIRSSQFLNYFKIIKLETFREK